MAACALERTKVEPPPQIITKWRTFDCGVPPAVDKVDFKPVVWEIIDDRYTLSTDMYANLGDNMSLIKQASSQMWQLVRFYEACIAAAQSNNEAEE